MFLFRVVCVLLCVATVLVSYGPDEIDVSDNDEDSGESLPSVFNVHNFQSVSCILSSYHTLSSTLVPAV